MQSGKRGKGSKLAKAIKPEDFIIVRYIFMMDEFGSDEEAVLEMLKHEFPKFTKLEILHRIQPYRFLAAQWYEKGRTLVHGLILGWIQANK